MIRTIFSIALLGCLGCGVAAQEQPGAGFDSNKLLIAGDAAKGTRPSVDMAYLDAWIGALAKHAQDYPVHFDSQAQKTQAVRDIQFLASVLDTLNNAKQDNPVLLRRAGFVNSMAHNLDVKGAPEKAVDYFSRLLKIAPDDATGNQMFGVFLGSAGRPEQAIPYLQKADSQGVAQATYGLAVAYLMVGDKPKGIEYLEKYRKAVPQDKSVEAFIDAVKNNRFETKTSP